MLGFVDGSDESKPSTMNPEYQTFNRLKIKNFKVF